MRKLVLNIQNQIMDSYYSYKIKYELWIYSTDHSKAVVPVLVLLFVALCGLFYEAICFKFCPMLFCSCVCQSF